MSKPTHQQIRERALFFAAWNIVEIMPSALGDEETTDRVWAEMLDIADELRTRSHKIADRIHAKGQRLIGEGHK